jgi:hypothetical protein
MVSGRPTPAPAALLEQLAELLAEALAPKIAAQIAAMQIDAAAQELPSRRLLTLDELVAQLPVGKKPETWKRWLYERTRRGLVPGCHKLGGSLFFDPEHTLPWLLAAGSATGDKSDWMSTGGDGTVGHVPKQATDRKAE